MAPLLTGSRMNRSFERLYKRHVGDVYRYSLAVMRSPADAEDVTQTTFLNAYRAFQRGERPQKPQNWLITIAHNTCRQRFRQAARRPTEVSLDEDLAEAIAPDDDAPNAADIRRALLQLAFNQRSALVMRELEGRSYAEIAEAFGISVSAVETLLFRARRALREQLEGTLTCREAELAVSRQLDGRLARAQRGPLRAHLRACAECARFARSQRAQRSAWKALALVPVPASLGSFFGGGAAATAGGAGLGTLFAAKTAAVVAGGALIAGASYETVKHPPWQPPRPAVARAVVAPPRSPTPPPAPTRARTVNPRPARSEPARSVQAPAPKPVRQTAKRDGPERTAKPAKPSKPAKPKSAKPVKVEKRAKHPQRGKPAPPVEAVSHEVERPVGLARGEHKAKVHAQKRARTTPAPAAGLAKREQRVRSEAKREAKRAARAARPQTHGRSAKPAPRPARPKASGGHGKPSKPGKGKK